jgi:hypothetical protein
MNDNSYTDIIFVDYENVGHDSERLHGLDKKYLIVYVTSKELNFKPNSNEVIEFFVHNRCKDALDFILDTYLGYFICMYGKKVSYHIMSRDKGFKNICNFWNSKGYKVDIVDSGYFFEVATFKLAESTYRKIIAQKNPMLIRYIDSTYRQHKGFTTVKIISILRSLISIFSQINAYGKKSSYYAFSDSELNEIARYIYVKINYDRTREELAKQLGWKEYEEIVSTIKVVNKEKTMMYNEAKIDNTIEVKDSMWKEYEEVISVLKIA